MRQYNGNIKQWSFEKFQQIAQELYRITKEGGVVVWIVGDATIKGSETGTSFRQALWFKECGFNLHDTMIWEKDTLSFPCSTRYGQCYEYMFILSKGKPRKVYKIADRKNKWAGGQIHGTSRNQYGETFRKSNDDKKHFVKEYGDRFNVWHISCEKSNKTGHPAVFPLQLAKDHIISWSDEADTVLDCFMGSGTTGIACLQTNRNFVGIEIDQQYYNISKERINKEAEKE